MKITMEKLKSVLNKYGYRSPIDDTLIDMYKEMGIEIIEEKRDKLTIAREFDPKEIYIGDRLYTLSYDVGKMKYLFEEVVAELQEQIQKMKNKENCLYGIGCGNNCRECKDDTIPKWQLED